MKKIGFIDYYLDEWHANNYPEMIKNANPEYEVCYAYGHVNPPLKDRVSNAQWSLEYSIPLVSSITELVEKSDCIVVLSPDNPEMHEGLADIALRKGKPVYIDKTFAPDVATAKRIFTHAERHGTPMYSCSSLNFADELADIKREGIRCVKTAWGGEYSTHIIHQIEPIAAIMGANPVRAKYTEVPEKMLCVEYANGATAQMTVREGDYDFAVEYEDGSEIKKVITSPFFDNFIAGMLKFFDTATVPVQKELTLAVIAVVEASAKAVKNPGEWIEISL